MASISCSTTTPLPFSKVDFHFPVQRATKFAPSIDTGKTHFQELSFSRFSRFRPNGCVVFSRLNDYSVEGSSGDSVKTSPELGVQSCTWKWRGYSIRYQCAGNDGPALVLVHGFGANSDHWRKNIPVLAKSHRVFSIDLIGYGYSDKPNPRDFGADSFYTFETWATQLNNFCVDVIKDEAFFICNSIGGVVGLQAAVMEPQICKGIMLLNISLRMLHIKKQPWYGKSFIRSFQNLLRNTVIGRFFYRRLATMESVKNILSQCYYDKSQVTEELVQKILRPGLEPGAVDVFLEFICYSGGPLPEELLPQVKCPVVIAWGDKDPWEPIELGRDYEKFDPVEDFIVLPNVGHCPQCPVVITWDDKDPWEPIKLGRDYGKFDPVEDFIVLPNVGHCPQDEAPNLVNPLIESFVARHSSPKATVSTV